VTPSTGFSGPASLPGIPGAPGTLGCTIGAPGALGYVTGATGALGCATDAPGALRRATSGAPGCATSALSTLWSGAPGTLGGSLLRQTACHSRLLQACLRIWLTTRASCGYLPSALQRCSLSVALRQEQLFPSTWGCFHPARRQHSWHDDPWESRLPVASARLAHRGPVPGATLMP
jgi:hypothetical protein